MSDKLTSNSLLTKLTKSDVKSLSLPSKNYQEDKKNIESENISMEQLELIANKKKMKRENENIIKEDICKESSRKTSSTISSTSTSSSSSLDNTKDIKKRERIVSKENKNEMIRREKNDYLFKFNKLNEKGKMSSLHLTMNNSLDEIRNEYERIKNELSSNRSVSFLKKTLLLGIQGIEMMNTRFDPFGVDLDGWSNSMVYSMENLEYDDILAELYDKYKSKGDMSPELRLIFMIISSATMFTITKSIYQPKKNQHVQQNYEDSSDTTSSEDFKPSKMKGPYTFEDNIENNENKYNGNDDNGINDNDINDILKTMKENNSEKSEMKNIDISLNKKRVGRPKKNINK